MNVIYGSSVECRATVYFNLSSLIGDVSGTWP